MEICAKRLVTRFELESGRSYPNIRYRQWRECGKEGQTAGFLITVSNKSEHALSLLILETTSADTIENGYFKTWPCPN